MREISGPEWDWLRQGVLADPTEAPDPMQTSMVLTSRLVELLDAKKENEMLKQKVAELTLRVQKLGSME